MTFRKRVLYRSTSGSVCDDSTRIWEDPPPPYSLVDPVKSSSSSSTSSFVSSGSDGEVFTTRRRSQSSSRRRRQSPEHLRIMRRNDSVLSSGGSPSPFVFDPEDLHDGQGAFFFRDENALRYLRQDAPAQQDTLDYLVVDHIGVEQAQKIYQEYRNCHTMKKIFSKSRNVDQVVTHHSFHYCLTTYAQQRSVERASRPYKAGERIPKISARATVPDKWDVECELNDGERVVIPNTTVKVDCKECCASGASCCHSCTGGKTSCYHCDGSGRTMRTETHVDGDAPRTTQHIKYESCHYCHAEGRVQCNRCGGRGRIQCRNCGGAKHMVEWEQVLVKITKTVDDEFSCTVPPDVDRTKLKRAGGHRYFTESAQDGALAPLHRDTCVDQGIVASSRKLLATHKAVRGRVFRQEHYTSLVPIHCAYLDKPGQYFYIVGIKHTPTFPKADKASCSIM